MGVLGGLTALTLSFTGGSKVQKTQGPPINASSGDEERFIKYASLLVYSPYVSDEIFTI
jgi:hypothetical protein